MGICGRCTSCSRGISRDAQNMSSESTSQNGKESILLFGSPDSLTYHGEWAPQGVTGSFSFCSLNRTSAFAFRRLDSVTQGQVGGTIIWSRMKCIAMVVFYHLIFTAQNGLWASPILTYLKRGVWPVNGPGGFDEVSFYCSPLLSFIFWYIL